MYQSERSERSEPSERWPAAPATQDVRFLQRLSVSLGVVLLGLVSSLLISLPTRDLTFNVLGSPLSLHISGRYVLVALIVGLACTGMDALIRTHPMAQRRQLRGTFSMWTVSAITVLLATLALPHAPSRIAWLVGVALVGVLLGLTMTAEFHTIDPKDVRFARSALFLTAMIYALALTMFVLVYSSKSRSLLSGTSLLIVAALLGLERLRVTGRDLATVEPFALVAGVVVGESVWALNYSRVPGIVGGILLLLSFHVVTGLAFQHLTDRLRWTIVLEYGAVALAGILLTVYFAMP